MRVVGGKAEGVKGDVSNLADLDRLYEVVRQEAFALDESSFVNSSELVAGGGSAQI